MARQKIFQVEKKISKNLSWFYKDFSVLDKNIFYVVVVVLVCKLDTKALFLLFFWKTKKAFLKYKMGWNIFKIVF